MIAAPIAIHDLGNRGNQMLHRRLEGLIRVAVGVGRFLDDSHCSGDHSQFFADAHGDRSFVLCSIGVGDRKVNCL